MGRHVLVTGGSRGIGRAIAEAFLADGDDVTITGRDEQAERTAAEIGARAVRLDLGDVDAVAALPEHLPEHLDVLVNNAGGFASHPTPPGAPLRDVAERWHRDLAVNLVGAVLVVTALEDRLREGGAVLSIGSIGAEYAANPYSAAKAALAAWNVGLAERLGPRGITANVVAPGYVEGTDLFGGPLGSARHDALVARTHVGRAGTPQDVATVVRMLTSPGARHVTGQTVHVDGGAFTTR